MIFFFIFLYVAGVVVRNGGMWVEKRSRKKGMLGKPDRSGQKSSNRTLPPSNWEIDIIVPSIYSNDTNTQSTSKDSEENPVTKKCHPSRYYRYGPLNHRPCRLANGLLLYLLKHVAFVVHQVENLIFEEMLLCFPPFARYGFWWRHLLSRASVTATCFLSQAFWLNLYLRLSKIREELFKLTKF